MDGEYTVKYKHRSPGKWKQNKYVRDSILRRITELREIYQIPWADVHRIIMTEFQKEFNGKVIPLQTLQGRYHASIKRRKVVNPDSTEKLIRKMRRSAAIAQAALMPAVTNGDPKAIKAMIDLNEQLAKLHGAFAPQKHSIESKKRVLIEKSEDDENLLAQIRKSFNSDEEDDEN